MIRVRWFAENGLADSPSVGGMGANLEELARAGLPVPTGFVATTDAYLAYRLPEYAGLGIDGVSIGSNDLTQLMLGVGRDSEVRRELFDEEDAAVLDAIHLIIQGSHEHGLTASLWGQAPTGLPLLSISCASVSIQLPSLPTPSMLREAHPHAAERRVMLEATRRVSVIAPHGNEWPALSTDGRLR